MWLRCCVYAKQHQFHVQLVEVCFQGLEVFVLCQQLCV